MEEIFLSICRNIYLYISKEIFLSILIMVVNGGVSIHIYLLFLIKKRCSFQHLMITVFPFTQLTNLQ